MKMIYQSMAANPAANWKILLETLVRLLMMEVNPMYKKLKKINNIVLKRMGWVEV